MFSLSGKAASRIVGGSISSILTIICILPSRMEDGLNQYIFPFAINIAKREKFTLAHLYLGTLYARLDEYVQNIRRTVGSYDVVMHVGSRFF